MGGGRLKRRDTVITIYMQGYNNHWVLTLGKNSKCMVTNNNYHKCTAQAYTCIMIHEYITDLNGTMREENRMQNE